MNISSTLDPLSPPSHDRLDVRILEKDPAPGIHLNREQSLRSIYLQNQNYTQDSFDALHAVSGAWGGREVNQPSAAPTVVSLCQDSIRGLLRLRSTVQYRFGFTGS